MSSPLHAAPGAGFVGATRGWSRKPGGMPFARGAWLERKMQRQKVMRHHGAANRGVAAPVRNDEAGRWVPLHQGFDVLASEMHLPTLVLVGHFGDHVVAGGDQRLELRCHLR